MFIPNRSMSKFAPVYYNTVPPIPSANLIWSMDFTSGLYQPFSQITGSMNGNYSIETDPEMGSYLSCTNDGWAGKAEWANGGDYLSTVLSGTDPFTFSFWLRAPQWNNYDNQSILSWRDSTGNPGATFYRDGYDYGGPLHNKINIRMGYCYWFYTGTDANYLDQWNHWAFVRDENGAKWYCNGALDNETSGVPHPEWDGGQDLIQNADVTASRNSICIGETEWGNYAVFDVTKYRIYNRALTSAEIYALYVNKA